MKNQALEGLRGVAAMMVIFSHLALTFWPGTQAPFVIHGTYPQWELTIFNSPLSFIYSGSLAVCIFFVMSGYVLSASFWKTLDARGITDLFARRYVRLMPPVLLSVIAGCLLLKTRMILAHAPDAPTWISWNYTLAPRFADAFNDGLWRAFLFDGANIYNPVIWTMKYEFIGSMITFSTCLIGANMRRRGILYLVLSIALLTGVHMGIYYVLFIGGIWLADGHKKPHPPIANFALGVAALWLGGYKDGSSWHVPLAWLHLSLNGNATPAYNLCNALGAFVIVMVVLQTESLAKCLTMLKELGRRSFSLYLIHFPILATVGLMIYREARQSVGDNFAGLIASSLVIIVSYVASGFYATWIDDTAIKASRRFAALVVQNRASGSSSDV